MTMLTNSRSHGARIEHIRVLQERENDAATKLVIINKEVSALLLANKNNTGEAKANVNLFQYAIKTTHAADKYLSECIQARIDAEKLLEADGDSPSNLRKRSVSKLNLRSAQESSSEAILQSQPLSIIKTLPTQEMVSAKSSSINSTFGVSENPLPLRLVTPECSKTRLSLLPQSSSSNLAIQPSSTLSTTDKSRSLLTLDSISNTRQEERLHLSFTTNPNELTILKTLRLTTAASLNGTFSLSQLNLRPDLCQSSTALTNKTVVPLSLKSFSATED